MINGTAEQFQKFAADYNKMVMEGWSSMTKQTIQSDAFASASGAFMDWSLATHKMMTEVSGQVMESLDLPKRSDLARISAQVQAVESRLLDQEDSQDEIRDLLVTLINKIEKMPAPTAASAVETAAAPPATEEKQEEETTKKPAAKKTKAATKSKRKSRSKKKTASAKVSDKKESN